MLLMMMMMIMTDLYATKNSHSPIVKACDDVTDAGLYT